MESAADIIDALAMARGASLRAPPAPDYIAPAAYDDPPHADLKARILELLGPTPIHRNEILRHADASPGALAEALMELVLEGEAVEHAGGQFARRLD